SAARMIARPIRNSPTPSRRSSGSRSRASLPIRRIPLPSPRAIPIHSAARPPPITCGSVLRCGCRRFREVPRPDPDLDDDLPFTVLVLDWFLLPLDRDFEPVREPPARDRGGEDARVAIAWSLRDGTGPRPRYTPPGAGRADCGAGRADCGVGRADCGV